MGIFGGSLVAVDEVVCDVVNVVVTVLVAEVVAVVVVRVVVLHPVDSIKTTRNKTQIHKTRKYLLIII
jgi:hypothetical protein